MSVMDPFAAAIFVTLDSAPGKPTGVTVHEYVKGDQSKPYIALGELTEVPRNTFKRKGYEDTYTIHGFSAAKGKAEALRMLTWITGALDGKSLNLSAPLKQGTLRYESGNVFKDPDGAYHLVARFRAHIQA